MFAVITGVEQVLVVSIGRCVELLPYEVEASVEG